MAENAAEQAEAEAARAGPVDAFILFNERETVVESIVSELSARDISTYFWRRDIQIGERWREIEDRQLRNARAVVVFLGREGWGPNHRPLAVQARQLEKRIIPVIIGDAPKEALEDVDGLFEGHRWVDLRAMTPAALRGLVDAIRPREKGPQFSGIVNTLVDGSDEQRADILRQIAATPIADKLALSARLRDEIQNRFSPEREDQFASAHREPKKIASIRSWMLSALIGIDAEEVSNRTLIIKHLIREGEPDRSVRFWALAGLYQRRASYLGEATSFCKADPMPEVASLARAIAEGDMVIASFRSMLQAEQFEIAWAVLRVLRIVPIKALAKDVCAQLDRVIVSTALTYDSLYALASPDMSAEAAPILRESPGVKRLVATIIAVLSNSDGNAVRNFALLLLAFEAREVESALSEAEKDLPDAGDTISAFRQHIRQLRQTGIAREIYVAGFASDTIDVEHDYLDIREDVQTLTAVMLATEVEPPLAIGLFGDWGSGKSYFMQSMKAAVRKRADDARNNPNSKFCSQVVSVEFNAWHYADANLWASLVSHILEGLAAHVFPKPTPEQQQADLIKQLDSAKAVLKQIETEKNSADEVIKDRQSDLQKLRAQREQKEVKLRELRLTDLRVLLESQPDVQKKLINSLEQMGVPATLTRISDLDEALSEVNSLRGRATALAVGLFNAQNKWLVIGLVACLIASPFLAAWLYQYLANGFVVMGTIIAEATVFIGGIVAFLRNAASHVKAHLSTFEKAKQQVDELLAKKRETPNPQELALEKEIASFKAQEEQAASQMRDATAKVIDLEQRITALRESRTLTHFLTQRMQSDDYRKHLGLISTIRRDFEDLARNLVGPLTDRSMARVERIILYIDDLDRCPADKVVEVLQAVHLLQAYPLFVVVVGVDPRWLAQSLSERYSPLRGGEQSRADSDLWRTTPQNYLEKIFQIPVSLRPMTSDGYAKLVQSLFSPRVPKPVPPPSSNPMSNLSEQPGQSADVRNAHVGEIAEKDKQPDRGKSGLTPQDTRKSTGATGRDAAREDFVIHEDALIIKPVESAFAQRLYRLMPSPRAAKRFSNIYRLLKAPTPPDRLQTFEGTEKVPGNFQVPMLLLAILIGMPDEAAALFPKLYDRVRAGEDPIDALASIEMQGDAAGKMAELRKRVKEVASGGSFPHSPALFAEWLPRVSRFSFEVGRAINPALAGQASL